jgi:hypothetical protein
MQTQKEDYENQVSFYFKENAKLKEQVRELEFTTKNY